MDFKQSFSGFINVPMGDEHVPVGDKFSNIVFVDLLQII